MSSPLEGIAIGWDHLIPSGSRSAGPAGGLLGQPTDAFAPLELGPDLVRADAGGGPGDGEMVEEVGTFADEPRLVLAHHLDHRLDRLLAQLLGDFGAAALEELRRVG